MRTNVPAGEKGHSGRDGHDGWAGASGASGRPGTGANDVATPGKDGVVVLPAPES